MPELFHHQDTFFGCLMVQRVPRHATSTALAEQLLHRAPHNASTEHLLLATQALDLGLVERCPALNAEQRCSIHGSKPGMCRVVPFDALLPDTAQHLVLAARTAEASYIGSDCIAPGARPGLVVVTRGLQVVDDAARAALARRRRDLAADARFWGRSVFQLLLPELCGEHCEALNLPAGGFITLSIAPVLMVLADLSARCRERCLDYLRAQLLLAERMLSSAQRQGYGEHEGVRRLAAFSRSNARLRCVLAAGIPAHTTVSAEERAAAELWLTT